MAPDDIGQDRALLCSETTSYRISLEAYKEFSEEINVRRLHLFEFEDQPWFPATIRDCMTDYLSHVVNQFNFYEAIVPILEKGVNKSQCCRIIDMGTGAGGGWPKLAELLVQRLPSLQIVLTDFYPNYSSLQRLVSNGNSVMTFEPDSIDARDVPDRLRGLRTQFLSFHHFNMQDARRILQNAVDARQPIAIFEAQKRDVAHLIQFALSPLGVWLLSPAIRPFKWSRLFLTYLLPVVPLCVFWDGLVSVLRTYNEDELIELTKSLDQGDSFLWEIGECRSGFIAIPYLLGYPR
ncbi:MAG: hypothetical protein NXI32_05485 [bacterium]|nr:hypothetical protein [bacterium]